MAERARTWSRPTLASVLVVAVALIASAYVGDDQQGGTWRQPPTTTGRREPPVDPRLEEIADRIGCSATQSSDRPGRFTGALLCTVDGETRTRIHIFDAADRASVKRRFSEALGDPPEGGIDCDGNVYRFVVLGDDWLVATSDHVVAGDLVLDLGAELVGPDGEPPASAAAADVCR